MSCWNNFLKEAWTTSQQTEINKREKIQALSLAKECYSIKLDLLTNATVVGDAMKFVSSNNNKKSVCKEEEEDNSSTSSQESKEQESDYSNEDKDQLEKKQEEELEKSLPKL